MTTKTFCDYCEQEMEPRIHNPKHQVVAKGGSVTDVIVIPPDNYDICDTCIAKAFAKTLSPEQLMKLGAAQSVAQAARPRVDDYATFPTIPRGATPEMIDAGVKMLEAAPAYADWRTLISPLWTAMHDAFTGAKQPST